jgi:hypothetical protein
MAVKLYATVLVTRIRKTGYEITVTQWFKRRRHFHCLAQTNFVFGTP